ncbi:hypothetical protein PYW08_011000 [Mythimna loreyi]|uniref:Uncharacterized protein n=1 Tax=Mythimna loreyi TaxID=667449 RepID=A0ACC2Q2B0_9NEOP|nr:hypothetical protein PYW08_011000 [Mythimna loreyi]
MLFMWNRAQFENLHQVVSNIFTAPNSEQFLIRLLEREEREQAQELIMQELLTNDPIVTAFNFDPDSERFLRQTIEEYLNQDIALGCFTQNGNTLVSIDCLYVRNLKDEFPTPEEKYEWTEPFRRLMKYVRLIEIAINHPKKCNYLTSFGIFTLAAYRDLRIPSELIRKRVHMAEVLRIEVIGSAFIGTEMLEAAETNKYKVQRTFKGSEDLAKFDLSFDLPEDIFPIEVMVKIRSNNQSRRRQGVRPRTRRQSALERRRLRSGPGPSTERLRSGPGPSAERLRSGPGPSAERLRSGPGPSAERLRSGPGPSAERLRSGPGPSAERLRSGPGPSAERSNP